MRTRTLYLLLLIISMPLLQCAKDPHGASIMPVHSNPVTRTMLALGDSYTIGQSVAADQRFPEQTAGFLKPYGISLDTIKYIARTGWTTIDLLRATAELPDNAIYDYVTLLIGVNDEYQALDIAEYPANFNALLAKAIRYAGGKHNHVMVISIPDYSITPYVTERDKAAVSTDIARYNAINKKMASDSSCAYVDINDVYREGANDATLIAEDHLHPSGKEYRKWATAIAGYIEILQ